jgi:hypothetical protein
MRGKIINGRHKGKGEVKILLSVKKHYEIGVLDSDIQ